MNEQQAPNRLIQAAQQQTQVNRFSFLRKSANNRIVERVIEATSARVSR